jgi:hypothetical protein
MEKLNKMLLIVLLLIFSVVMASCAAPPKTHSTPVAKEAPDITKTMYLKGGRIIECDIVWEGMASQILCNKSDNIIAYSAGDVDLIRTFGESSAKEIAERYEERKKYEELLVKPPQFTVNPRGAAPDKYIKSMSNPIAVVPRYKARTDLKAHLARKYSGSFSTQKMLLESGMESYDKLCSLPGNKINNQILSKLKSTYYPHFSTIWMLYKSNIKAYRDLQQ